MNLLHLDKANFVEILGTRCVIGTPNPAIFRKEARPVCYLHIITIILPGQTYCSTRVEGDHVNLRQLNDAPSQIAIGPFAWTSGVSHHQSPESSRANLWDFPIFPHFARALDIAIKEGRSATAAGLLGRFGVPLRAPVM